MKKITDLVAEPKARIGNLDVAGVDKEQAGGVTATVARWSVGGIFLEAFANRDYAQLATTLGSAVRFRALLPPGPMAWEGSEAVTKAFSSWFGEADEFELIDATVGGVGGRLHLSWRLRVRPAPFGIGDGWHVIEQHAYADATDTIDTLDLLCSGFNPERVATRGD